MKKINIILITILLIGFTTSCNAQQRQDNIQTEIIATWVAEDDPNVKLVFNNSNQCLNYYDNILIDTYPYTISDECGSETDSNSWFLKLTDNEDFSIRCYELYGANQDNNNKLSMRDMITGKIFIYNKQ